MPTRVKEKKLRKGKEKKALSPEVIKAQRHLHDIEAPRCGNVYIRLRHHWHGGHLRDLNSVMYPPKRVEDQYDTLQERLQLQDHVWVPAHRNRKYLVSNFGEVCHRDQVTGHPKQLPIHPLKGGTNKDGYKTVSLSNGNRLRHVLVINSFYINPLPSRLDTVEHLDNCRQNAHLSNLIFATRTFQNQPENRLPKPVKRST